MKLRYPILVCVALHILIIITDHIDATELSFLLQDIEGPVIFLTLAFALYKGITTIFQKRKTKGSQSNGYRSEAQRACEKVTPKRDKNAVPPWEE